MSGFTASSCIAFAVLSLVVFFLETSVADPSFSFSLGNFGKDPSFNAGFALYGDAMVVNDGSSVQMQDSTSHGSGGLMCNKPIKLIEGKSKNPASFSSSFSFSMTSEHGGSLAFVLLPSGSVTGSSNRSLGFPVQPEEDQTQVVSVEFSTYLNVAKFGDSSENHVAVIVGGSVAEKVSNFTSLDLVLNSDSMLHSWVDYEASSNKLEVRLSKNGEMRPIDPLISYSTDLSKMWNGNEVFVGINSSNGNSSQNCYLHSWSFNLRHYPRWMHSYPVDPESFRSVEKRNSKLLQVLTCFITSLGSVALTVFTILYLWTMCHRRNLMMVVPEECGLKTKDFEYKKVEAVVGQADQASEKN